jgi:hypothetical protein
MSRLSFMRKQIKGILRTAVLGGALLACFLPGNASELRLQTGGTQIVLPSGWEILNQPTNYFVQVRAADNARGLTLSAGVVPIWGTLDQFVTMSTYGLSAGTDKLFERMAKLTHQTVEQIRKEVESIAGRQLLGQIKESEQALPSELLGIDKIVIANAPAYEVRSSKRIKETGESFFARTFAYRGADPAQIVTVTFASFSDEIFTATDLLKTIHRPTPTNDLPVLTVKIHEPAGGFFYLVPETWSRKYNENKKKSPDAQFDRVAGPMIGGLPSGLINALGWRVPTMETALQETAKAVKGLGAKNIRLSQEKFTALSGANGIKISPFAETEEGKPLHLYAFSLSNSRVVVFLCFPTLAEDRDLAGLYESILKTFQRDGVR